MTWPTATLGDCGEIQGGLQVTSKRESLPFSRPYLRVANVHRGRLDLTEIKVIRATQAEADRTRLQCGDLLFVEGHANPDEVGRVAVWDGSIPDCVHQNHLIRVRLDPSVLLPAFAVAWFNSPHGASHFRRAGRTTSGLNTISANTIRSAPTLLPPLAEQRRIVAVLDQAGGLLSNRSRVKELEDELVRAIFLDMFGSPITNPKGWETVRLLDVGTVSTGKTPPTSDATAFGGPIPFVTPGDLDASMPPARSLSIGGAARSRIVRSGAAFVCCIGATIGKVGMASVRSAFNQQINAVEWGPSIQDQFGVEMMRLMKLQIVTLGSSTTMPILSKSKFGKLIVPVPPLELQKVYASRVERLSLVQSCGDQALCASQSLLNSLLTRAISGQL